MIKFSIATCKQQTHASKPQRIQDYFHKKKKKNRIRYLALLERRHLKSHHHLNVETLNQRQRTEIELFSVRSFVRSHLSRAHCSIGTRFLNDRIATQSRQNNRQITEPHTHNHTHTHTHTHTRRSTFAMKFNIGTSHVTPAATMRAPIEFRKQQTHLHKKRSQTGKWPTRT
jgi:hypothetical protein